MKMLLIQILIILFSHEAICGGNGLGIGPAQSQFADHVSWQQANRMYHIDSETKEQILKEVQDFVSGGSDLIRIFPYETIAHFSTDSVSVTVSPIDDSNMQLHIQDLIHGTDLLLPVGNEELFYNAPVVYDTIRNIHPNSDFGFSSDSVLGLELPSDLDTLTN